MLEDVLLSFSLCPEMLSTTTTILLLRFLKTCKLLSSKAAFTNVFSPVVNHNFNHKEQTSLETQKHTKRTEIHQSQITIHDLLNPLK